MYQKIKPWRSEKYMKWIREQPCVVCWGKAVPHHLKGVGNMGGVGTKAPDWTCQPLCIKCHADMHRDSSNWPMQWENISRTIGKAIDEEIIVIK